MNLRSTILKLQVRVFIHRVFIFPLFCSLSLHVNGQGSECGDCLSEVAGGSYTPPLTQQTGYNGVSTVLIPANQFTFQTATLLPDLFNTPAATFTAEDPQLPGITADGPTTFCAPGSVVLTADEAFSYQWLLNNAPVAGATTKSYMATQSGSYAVMVTNILGEAATSSPVIVTANPLPTAIAGNGGAVFSAGTISLTALGGNSYSWVGPNGFTSAFQNPILRNATIANAGTYTVTVTKDGCTATASTNVTVNTVAAGALNFDGVNDKVKTPAMIANQSNFTVEGWVNWAGILPAAIYSETTPGNDNPMFSMIIHSNGIEVVLRNGSRVGLTAFSNEAMVTPNQWTHVAFVRTSATTAQLLVNGIKKNDYTFTNPGSIPVTTGNIGVRERVSQDGYLNGALEELRIWNRAFCAGEILNNLNNGLIPGAQTGLMAYYNFNQGLVHEDNSAQYSLADGSGNNRKGLLLNFTLSGAVSNYVTGFITGTVPAFVAPAATAGGNSPIVSGGSINLTATGPGTFSWTGPNGFTSNLQNPVITNATTANAGTYTVTVTKDGCTATASTNVAVNTLAAGALNFDGVNDYVNITNPFRAFQKEITVEWSANIDPASPLGSGISQSVANVDGSNSLVWMMHYNGDGGDLQFYVSDNGTWKTVGAPVPAGWHKWAGVANGSSLKLYRDGVLVATSAIGVNGAILNVANSAIHLGKDSRFVAGRFLKGSIDEVRIWNRALCEEEIANNNAGELVLPQTGLQGYYKFNQGRIFEANPTQALLTDASGNNRTGQLTGFSLTGATSNYVAGFVTGPAPVYKGPEINVQGSAISILNGDVTPAPSDGTDFGGILPNVSVTKTFTIANTGTALLNLNGITLTGPHAANFTLSQVQATVPPGSFVVFTVTFHAATLGPKSATVTIHNTDCDESIYTFALKGEITCTPPVFTAVPADITQNTAAGSNKAPVSYIVTATGTPGATMAYTLTGATSGSGPGTGSGALFNFGETTVTITASNSCGTVSRFFKVIIRDPEAPVPVIAVLPTVSGECSATVTAPRALDNTSGLVMATTTDPLSYTSQGTYTLTWTYTDNSGNFVRQTQQVVVQDHTLPVLAPAPDLVLSSDAGKCGVALILTAPVATDNCGVANVINDAPAFFPVGTTTVTWIVRDVNNLTSTSSQAVTVTDTEHPLALTQNLTVYLNASGHAAITAAEVNYGSADNCGIESITLDKTTFDCSQAGMAIPVTLTVTDIHGNVSTATATVTVADREKPVITSNGNQVVDADTGVCGALVTVSATATDNCRVGTPAGIRSDGLPLTALFPVGTTTITWQVNDVNGNASPPLTQTVVVTDTGKPLVLTKNITVYLDATGIAAITPADIDNGSHDNCGIQTLTVDQNTFNCSQVGQAIRVTLTITNIHGHVAAATAEVSVLDKIKPELPEVADITLNKDKDGCGATVFYAFPVGTDNCVVNTVQTAGLASGSLFPVGTTTNTFVATDASGNTSAISFTVTVTDTEAPVLVTNGPQTVNTDAGVCGAAVTVWATPANNCSVGVPVGVRRDGLPLTAIYPVGTTTITWTVTDAQGKAALPVLQTVTVHDQEKPLALTRDISLLLDVAGQATLTPSLINNGSDDNCGIAALTLSKTLFDWHNLGLNTVTLTVADIHGNFSTANAKVLVMDKVPPVALAKNILVSLDAGSKVTVTPEMVDNGSHDACGIGSLVLSRTTFDCTTIGANKVTLTVTDKNGNVSAVEAIVTVVDKIAPVVATRNITVQLNAAGAATITPAMINAGSTDGCGIAALALSKTSFTCGNLGVNVVNLTVTDVNGNVSTNTALVTVEDKTAPVALARNVSLTLVNGSAVITPAMVDNGSYDGCGIRSLVLSRSSFDCRDVDAAATSKTYPVTLTVTDLNGNVSVATSLVTVIGTKPLPAIAVSRTDKTPTGTDANTIILGYGAQKLTFTASNTTAGVTAYAWSPASGLSNSTIANPVFTPTAAGTYTFVVTATNTFGCSETAAVIIKVVDATCGTKGDKVLMCHKGQVTCVGPEGVAAHLAHGCTFGACKATMNPETRDFNLFNLIDEVHLMVYPNPSAGITHVSFNTVQAGSYRLEVFDTKGALVKALASGRTQGSKLFYQELDASAFQEGVYLIKLTTDQEVTSTRLLIAR